MKQQITPVEPGHTVISADDLYRVLDRLAIAYEIHEHEPTFTVAESDHLKTHIPGIHCRNLFLRDKKKAMFLVVAANDTAVDLKKLQNLIDSARLSFGSPDRLWEFLGVKPGSVCPFAVINDTQCQIQVILDQDMMTGGLVNYHPMDNAKTISLTPADLLKFFAHTGHEAKIMDLKPAAPDPA